MSYIYIYIYIWSTYFDVSRSQRRSTVGRTPLDEWSVRRRDLYLTRHDTHNRQISMSPVGFEPTILYDIVYETHTTLFMKRHCLWNDIVYETTLFMKRTENGSPRCVGRASRLTTLPLHPALPGIKLTGENNRWQCCCQDNSSLCHN